MISAKKKDGVKRKHCGLSITEKVEMLRKFDGGISVQTIRETYNRLFNTV